jgi:hypothetical protein
MADSIAGTPRASGISVQPNSAQAARAKGVNEPELKPREPKWSVMSRLKNAFVEGRKADKIQQWEAKLDAQLDAHLEAVQKAEKAPRWKTTAVSLPFNTVKTGYTKKFSPTEARGLRNPSLDERSVNANHSRLSELNNCIDSHAADDFKVALFRADQKLPNEWVVEHKLVLQPIVDVMQGRMTTALAGRDPVSLSQDELHDIAAKTWSLLIPGLYNSAQQEIPEDSKFLLQEMLNACAASEKFKVLNDSERKNALKSVFYMAYFNRGIQPLLSKTSPRLAELKAIPESQLTDLQKSERESEEKLVTLALRVADFGAAACGLKNSGKTTSISATEHDVACGTSFYQTLSNELLNSARVVLSNAK